MYRGISASEGSWCPWEQLRQEEGWQGLERGKQRCWNGHHCSSLGQEGGSARLDSLGTHRAIGEHAGPPQPARKETSQCPLYLVFSLRQVRNESLDWVVITCRNEAPSLSLCSKRIDMITSVTPQFFAEEIIHSDFGSPSPDGRTWKNYQLAGGATGKYQMHDGSEKLKES